jgi:osmoprotectant transport system substrate-binding protein
MHQRRAGPERSALGRLGQGWGVVLAVVLTIVGISAIAGCQATAPGGGAADITIASKDFTEQDILGELLAQQIEHQTNLKVARKPRLGFTFICHQALLSGKIDAYIEYTGTAYTTVLKEKSVDDARALYRRLQQGYQQRFNLVVMPGLGFENTFAMIMRGADAQRMGIRTLSEAAAQGDRLRGGFGYEFVEREDGLPGLTQAYNLRFGQPPQQMSLDLLYRALVQNQVDLIAANSTDGQIARLGLTILQDDKRYFPPYEAVPIVRAETLQKYPQVRAAIAQLAGRISAAEMQQMNYQVEGELRDVQGVAREFLVRRVWE